MHLSDIALRAVTPHAVGGHPACGRCRHFSAAPEDIEREIAGLVVMGSGYSSVRDEDGICRLRDRYLTRTNHCGSYAAR